MVNPTITSEGSIISAGIAEVPFRITEELEVSASYRLYQL
jgi:hypothetical protein